MFGYVGYVRDTGNVRIVGVTFSCITNGAAFAACYCCSRPGFASLLLNSIRRTAWCSSICTPSMPRKHATGDGPEPGESVRSRASSDYSKPGLFAGVSSEGYIRLFSGQVSTRNKRRNIGQATKNEIAHGLGGNRFCDSAGISARCAAVAGSSTAPSDGCMP
jgi:hypothetical protein